MNESLERIREYFEQRQDASREPGDDRYRGNETMDRLRDVQEVERALSETLKRAELAEAELRAARELYARNQMGLPSGFEIDRHGEVVPTPLKKDR